MSASPMVLLVLVLVGLASVAGELPNGIHLSLTENQGEMRAMWSLPKTLFAEGQTALCLFGLAPTQLSSTSSTGIGYTYAAGGFNGTLFSVVMSKLLPDSTYFYKCGSDAQGWSNVFSFPTPPSKNTATVKMLIWGDMGVDNLVSTPKFTREAVAQDVQEGNYTLLINVGDTSYANDYKPAETNSYILDEYWASVEPAAAHAPAMLCPGNHEAQFDFAGHLNRTFMPVVSNGTLNRFYYSFTYGPVYFITFSTEHPWSNNTEQWEYVLGELQRANSMRDQFPWLVVWTHHPFYCSGLIQFQTRCQEEMTAYLASYESIFNDYAVDLFLAGHNHMYERTFPVRDRQPIKNYHRPGAPVYVVEGDAGTIESIVSLVVDVPWRAFHGTGRETGYGRMEVNMTALTYTHVVSRTREVIDQFTLTK